MQAIEYIREKRKRPDTNAIYEHLKKTEASNIDKETIGNIISEFINQKILENKKSTYGNSFRLRQLVGFERLISKSKISNFFQFF